MRVLGIDPGYDRLGIAVIQHKVGRPEKIIFSTCLTTPRTIDFSERLWQLANKTENLIKKYRPQLLAIEKLFFSANRKTALAVAEMRGALLYLARKLKVPVIDLRPIEVKIAITGYGQADKNQMRRMVERLFSVKQALKQDDEVDALAIALTGALRAGPVYPQVGQRMIAKK